MTTTDDGVNEYNLGMGCLDKQDDHKALEHFRRSLAAQPHFKTCLRIAQILTKAGKVDEAAAYIEQAYILNPANSQTATAYAELLARRELRDDAISVLQKTLSSNNSYGPARRLLNSMEND
jgi:tetratricopeptide (TPR) repeat protein